MLSTGLRRRHDIPSRLREPRPDERLDFPRCHTITRAWSETL
jgi:hypothetical protein